MLYCPGADPENFSRGGPTLRYNCGSAQIWKITIFFISSNIGDIKLCKFPTPTPPLDPRMLSVQSVVSLWYKTHYISNTHCIGNNVVNFEYSHPVNSKFTTWQYISNLFAILILKKFTYVRYKLEYLHTKKMNRNLNQTAYRITEHKMQ